jgi:hypothetical protein
VLLLYVCHTLSGLLFLDPSGVRVHRRRDDYRRDGAYVEAEAESVWVRSVRGIFRYLFSVSMADGWWIIIYRSHSLVKRILRMIFEAAIPPAVRSAFTPPLI